MGNVVVVYGSKYGTTEKYAQWIAEELSCKAIKKEKAGVEELLKYDTIIYGGGLYAGSVNGVDLLTKNFEKLSSKNLILFTCGLSDPGDENNVNHIREGLKKVLTPEMEEKIKIFHLHGGIDYSKLGLMHKAMMAMLCKMLRKQEYDTMREEDKQMLEYYGKAVDFTDKNAIIPIVDWVHNEC